MQQSQGDTTHSSLFFLLQGSKASVQSQPADTSSLLQIPKDHFHHMRAHDPLVRESKAPAAAPVHSPSAERLLRRQVSRTTAINLLGFCIAAFPGYPHFKFKEGFTEKPLESCNSPAEITRRLMGFDVKAIQEPPKGVCAVQHLLWRRA